MRPGQLSGHSQWAIEAMQSAAAVLSLTDGWDNKAGKRPFTSSLSSMVKTGLLALFSHFKSHCSRTNRLSIKPAN